jgi:hypothetical protein
MISEEDKRFVAPCGLYCLDPYCPLLRSSEGKQVKALANKLDECIESNKYQDALAAWTAYQGFDKMMKILSTKAGTCEGCRSTIAAYPECSVRQCCLFDKKLNFCYQCSEFPCTKFNKLNEGNLGRCLNNLQGIKASGLEEWLKQKKNPKRI